jgi:ACS family pantothenate transporter-like MFS transporter
MNTGSNVINAWWSIVFYGASMAPWFIVSFRFLQTWLYEDILTCNQRGMWAMIACSIAMVIWCAALTWRTHKYLKDATITCERQSLEHEKHEVGKEAA